MYPFSASIGSVVEMKGENCRVIGRFHDRYYIADNGAVSDAYALVFDGRKEIGSKYSNGKYTHSWFSRFSRTYPLSKLGEIKARMNVSETGITQRLAEEGNDCEFPAKYIFGTKMGMGIFLAIHKKEGTFDVWVNKRIEL